MCASSNGLTHVLRLCFEKSTRAIDPSKNQPNRLRCGRECQSLAGTARLTGRFPRRSSRHYDECFNLAHAQQLKNKDIPEGGSKGVVLIDATAPGAGDAWGAQDAADFHDYLCRKSTKAYTDGVLDLCLPGDGEAQSLLPMVYLGPDEQIVPEDINWVVANAKRRGHPTADAFMSSKPDAGVNHKEFGVTSEGVHVFLEAALRDTLHIDPKVDPFTVKLTGGPDAVWKPTTGLGGPDQTSELSSSVKSKSIRLIFGRIDCSCRALEAEPKSLCRNIRIRSH